jgi:hypothetical protein
MGGLRNWVSQQWSTRLVITRPRVDRWASNWATERHGSGSIRQRRLGRGCTYREAEQSRPI